MQFNAVKKRSGGAVSDTRVFASLGALIRLQFEARGFSFLPRQPVNSVLYGRHASRVRGRGLNFEELRNYEAGDDIRNVDWKATARTGSPQVRVYNEERDRPVWLLVNQRQCMFFGSQHRTKSVTAAEMVALAAWRVTGLGDRVGAIVYNDQQTQVLRPRNSKQQVMRILKAVVDMNLAMHQNRSTDAVPNQFDAALQALQAEVRHDALICLIGDGSGVSNRSVEAVTRLNAHNDILMALIYDPMEATLPNAGVLAMKSGHQRVSFDSTDRRLRSAYSDDFKQRLAALKQLSLRHEIPLLQINTIDPVAEQVRSALGHQRATRRR